MPPLDASDGDRRRAVVFGPIQDPAKAMAYAESALPAGGRLGPAIARLGPGDEALRLNSAGWLRLRPQEASSFATQSDRLEVCRTALIGRAPLFARPLRAFLSNYVTFVTGRIEAEREALVDGLARSGITARGGVINYRDFAFSAFLPLPNAYLQFASGRGFARVDCVFWTGQTLLAVRFAGLTMPRPSETAALRALEEEVPELRVAHVTPAAEGDLSAFEGPLRAHLTDFVSGCVLPFGPFRLPQLSDAGRGLSGKLLAR